MKRIKTLIGYAAHARFNAQLSNEIRWFADKHAPAKAKYSGSPTRAASKYGDQWVWICETEHRRYEVWQIDEKVLHVHEADAMKDQFTPN